MTSEQAKSVEIQDHRLWNGLKGKRMPLSFDLEITARCNNNCRHCCINLPSGDQAARDRELSDAEISNLADEAVSLGARVAWVKPGVAGFQFLEPPPETLRFLDTILSSSTGGAGSAS